MRKLAIVGITGRMGREILSLSKELGFNVTSGVAASGEASVEGVAVVADIEKLDVNEVDVVIDFSLPEATEKVLGWCYANKKPLVSGVTGITHQQKAALAHAGQFLPVLWSPNMSLGVAVMGRLFAQLSKLEGFDFQIEELHHNRKKDKPSGTALLLQERLTEAVGDDVPAPLAIRGGGIFGIHRLWAMGEEEMLTIEHTAMNRRVFARGALRAAQWLLGKPAGLYRLDDVLGT